MEDQDLTEQNEVPNEFRNGLDVCRAGRRPPIISGFIALIKVFLCVVDLLSKGFPGSPPQAYAMTSGSLRQRIFPHEENTTHSTDSRSTVSLASLLRIIKKLQSTLDELPEELKIQTLDPQLQSPSNNNESQSTRSYQFDIMRANIHITSLYIQSTILETCSSAFRESPTDTFSTSPGDDVISSPGYTPRTQLWKFRESIARELLDMLNFCSTRTLEANGSSMVRISTLLE